MAARSSLCFRLFLVALLPTFANCHRPFSVPKSLFVQGTSPFTLPEGAHVIRREDGSEVFETPEELVEDLRGQLRSRFRRASPIVSPRPEKSSQSLAQSFDTLYMYWPRNSGSENYVFLLAKNTKKGSDQTISQVYVSSNYGKNFTDLGLISKNGGKAPLIHQIYSSKADPTLCILADKVNKALYRSENLVDFTRIPVIFQPSFITFHPSERQFAMAYDSSAEELYWSSDAGKTFTIIQGKVKSFHWGVEGIQNPNTIFVEMYRQDRDTTKDNRTTVQQVENGIVKFPIAENIEEFEVMKNYMFITTRKDPSDKNPVMKVAKIVKGTPIRGSFLEAKFPLNEESRDFFVFDVVEDFVFVVINHKKNLSNMYISDTNGANYQLSLPRVLYHNPYTDVSSPWLRLVVPYAFVDVDRVKGMRGIYIATQLTPGPVGKRHLLSLITYNRGGKWERIKSPTVDIRNARINCYLPSCSLHLNLLYGAVYRVSPSDRMFSSESAPGLVLALGVASTNLKIYPDLFMSLDGGVGWSRVLRGKHLFTFGDHGGVIMAVPYRRYTRTLSYSINGGASWNTYTFSSGSVLARDVVTQPGERLPVFLIYGTVTGQASKWTVFYINMTSILGPVCNSSGYALWEDGCILGRQQEFETRNWTINCHMGRNFKRAKALHNCPCERDDFQCDYGFQRKAIDEECTPIRQGEDLDHAIIPANCPEGQNYTRTQGFRKIPGDTCVNGTEKDFLPVLTPCPVKELFNLTLTSSNLNGDGIPAIVTGENASFTASLLKGHYPNINFKWFFGDGHDESGSGERYRKRQHKYDKAGKHVVSVIASNTRSILVARLDLNVQEKLDEKKMNVTFKPKDPRVNQDVIFSASLNYSNIYAKVGNVHYKWKYDDKEIQSWQPVATLQFSTSKTYNVLVTAKNFVSEAKKIVKVQVTKDLTPRNVVATVLGPSKVQVKWDPPLHADGSIKGYKVFHSTTSINGFTESTCEAPSSLSCKVINLIPATTYHFKVQAFTTAGDTGAFSDSVIATTNTSTPGAPRGLRAYPISSSVIHVSWQPPATPNGKITSYMNHTETQRITVDGLANQLPGLSLKIRYWSNHDTTARTLDNGLVLSRNFTGLLQDTYYFFEVYAESARGRSIAIGPVQALTLLSKPTQMPRQIQKVSDNGTCAMLTWKAPYLSADDKRAFPAKGYKVQVDTNPIIDAATTFKIVCKLKPGQVYIVKVWAYSEAGSGPAGQIKMTTQSIKPGPPQNVRCGAVSPTQITLNWDTPANSGPDGITYEVYQVSPYKDKPYTASITSYRVDGLRSYTSYKFSILAKNRLGSSAKSVPVTCKTSETTPGVVRYVTAETINPKAATIKITWSTPDEPNGEIIKYKITWGIDKVSSSRRVNEVQVTGSTSAYTFKNLFSSTSYSFIVIPVNKAGAGFKHIDPVKEKTFAAMKGTERLQLDYDGAMMNGEDSLKFIGKFIEAATAKAGILDVRLAAVVVKDSGKVLFDLLPPLNASGVSMEKAKSALNDGFKAEDWKLVRGTLKLVFVYAGDTSPTPKPGGNGEGTSKPGGKPTMAAQKGARSDDSNSKKTYLAIAVPLALIGIALLGGMIFFFMKYKSLQKHYRQMGDPNHEEDEMKVVYHEDMQADSPDVIFSDRSRKKFYNDSEKVPLGENDELAMI